MATAFWMIRHALVEEQARQALYGTHDVPVCEPTLVARATDLALLADRLPLTDRWIITPLSRTRRTAEAIFDAGYPPRALTPEPDLIEQHLGDWQGLAHAALPSLLSRAAHAFWPLAGEERPPGGESMTDVIHRVGHALERLALEYDGEDVVVISHGGTIRAAVAHALGIGADAALHLSVQNLSLTRLERHEQAWRVVSVNEHAGV
jgi:broad specificity phosphatase PhoE